MDRVMTDCDDRLPHYMVMSCVIKLSLEVHLYTTCNLILHYMYVPHSHLKVQVHMTFMPRYRSLYSIKMYSQFCPDFIHIYLKTHTLFLSTLRQGNSNELTHQIGSPNHKDGPIPFKNDGYMFLPLPFCS